MINLTNYKFKTMWFHLDSILTYPLSVFFKFNPSLTEMKNYPDITKNSLSGLQFQSKSKIYWV